jgi:hypothetical protein
LAEIHALTVIHWSTSLLFTIRVRTTVVDPIGNLQINDFDLAESADIAPAPPRSTR